MKESLLSSAISEVTASKAFDTGNYAMHLNKVSFHDMWYTSQLGEHLAPFLLSSCPSAIPVFFQSNLVGLTIIDGTGLNT